MLGELLEACVLPTVVGRVISERSITHSITHFHLQTDPELFNYLVSQEFVVRILKTLRISPLRQSAGAIARCVALEVVESTMLESQNFCS